MESFNIWDGLNTKEQPIVLFGASAVGKKVYYFLQKTEITAPAICFCDNAKYGIESSTGAKIISPSELMQDYSNAFVIVCVQSSRMCDEIVAQLRSLSFPMTQIATYPQIAQLIIDKTGVPDWTDIEPTFDWSVNHRRIEQMAQWIEKTDRSVIDIGAGDSYLKKILPEQTVYIPMDYTARTEAHIVYDFNKDPFPDITADVCFLSKCLYLANDWRKLLKSAFHAAAHKVMVDIVLCNKETDTSELEAWKSKIYSVSELTDVAEESEYVLKDSRLSHREAGFVGEPAQLLFVKKEGKGSSV